MLCQTLQAYRANTNFPIAQINSPVIVDFKSAYEHEPDWRPKWTPMHIVFWQYVHNTIFEIPLRTCSHADCHKISCLEDASLLQQRAAVSKRIRDINIVLDDHKLENKEQIEKFKEDMKSRDLLHLVPGQAYAFALRNRRWGTCCLIFIGDGRLSGFSC